MLVCSFIDILGGLCSVCLRETPKLLFLLTVALSCCMEVNWFERATLFLISHRCHMVLFPVSLLVDVLSKHLYWWAWKGFYWSFSLFWLLHLFQMINDCLCVTFIMRFFITETRATAFGVVHTMKKPRTAEKPEEETPASKKAKLELV